MENITVTQCNHTRKLNEFLPAFTGIMVTHRMQVFVCAHHEVDILVYSSYSVTPINF